jgi:uncharacterized protein (DUF2384 family)
MKADRETGGADGLKEWLDISPSNARDIVAGLEPEGEARLLHLCLLAEDLFNGERQAARLWVLSPAYAFKGETPFEHAQTEEGSREVEALIGRIRHGIPT